MAPPPPCRGDAPGRSAQPRGRHATRGLRGAGACRGIVALALGVAIAASSTWYHSQRHFDCGFACPATRDCKEPLVPRRAVKEMKAEDIGKMYASGDEEIDEVADDTWKQHFRVAFEAMDHNNDGKICLEEFSTALSDMGAPFTKVKEDGVANIFKLADSTGTGYMNFGDFIAWQKSTRSLLTSFLQLDLDRDGMINKDEWRVAIRDAGVDWTSEECDENFDGADLDGDGFLDFSEYTMWAAKA